MLLTIRGVLEEGEAASIREALEGAGRTSVHATACYLSQRDKNNEQLREDHHAVERRPDLVGHVRQEL